MFHPITTRRACQSGAVGRTANEFDRALNRLFSAENTGSGSWTPAVDVTESDEDFKVTVDLPGLSPSDVEVSVDNGILAIEGARTREKTVEGKRYHLSERLSGSFKRRFNLPELVDADAVAGRFGGGVLELTLPKRPQAQPKKVEISTSA